MSGKFKMGNSLQVQKGGKRKTRVKIALYTVILLCKNTSIFYLPNFIILSSKCTVNTQKIDSKIFKWKTFVIINTCAIAEVGKTKMWVVEASLGVCKGQLLLIFSSILKASAMIWKEVKDSKDTRQALRMAGVSQLPTFTVHWPHFSFIFLPASSKFFLLNKPDHPETKFNSLNIQWKNHTGSL